MACLSVWRVPVHRRVILLVLTLLTPSPVLAVEPAPAERDSARRWVKTHLGAGRVSSLPFSFRLGGRPSRDVLSIWKVESSEREAGPRRTERTIRLSDPETGLEVRCVAMVYHDLPAVEWVLHTKNTGPTDTPILDELRSLDCAFGPGADDRPFTLYHAEGSHEKLTDFRPRQDAIGPGGRLNLSAFGGRSSDGTLPFFNVAMPGGGGVAIGVGWTGQWAATFGRVGAGSIRVQAGMERFHARLHPGEEFRTPSTLLVFWDGPVRIRGQNMLRRVLLEHASPAIDDRPVVPPCAASPHAVIPFEGTTEANMLKLVANIATRKVPFDAWWIDTGWFPCETNWARHVGNPDPDPARFPHGLKPVADAAHSAGMKFLLWFEPERVMPGTWLHDHHPDWLLRPADAMPPELRYQVTDRFHLLDLGNPQALAWLESKLSGMVRDIGIDIFRNDFNMYPLYYWTNGEPVDRQGVRETRYVTGLYHLFDTLRREHPDLLLDNCASGGRRIDFEMLRRALVLTRSDYLWDPTGQQCHTYGLAQWVPITGIGAASLDVYSTRSGLGSHFTFAADYGSEDPSVWSAVTRTVGEVRRLRQSFTGDFYPLSAYSTSGDAWMSWQFHRDDLGEGLVQAFRRQDSLDEARTFPLQGLEATAVYVITESDTNASRRVAGLTLMEQGWTFRLPTKRFAAFITYRKADGKDDHPIGKLR